MYLWLRRRGALVEHSTGLFPRFCGSSLVVLRDGPPARDSVGLLNSLGVGRACRGLSSVFFAVSALPLSLFLLVGGGDAFEALRLFCRGSFCFDDLVARGLDMRAIDERVWRTGV